MSTRGDATGSFGRAPVLSFANSWAGGVHDKYPKQSITPQRHAAIGGGSVAGGDGRNGCASTDAPQFDAGGFCAPAKAAVQLGPLGCRRPDGRGEPDHSG